MTTFFTIIRNHRTIAFYTGFIAAVAYGVAKLLAIMPTA